MKPFQIVLILVVPGGTLLLLPYLLRIMVSTARRQVWRLGYLRNLLSIMLFGGPLGRIRIRTALRALREWPAAVVAARGAYVLDDALGL
jgi:hypothetical protein